jgi:hypothetical protein
MRKSKFSESQIVGILKDAESGVPVPELSLGRVPPLTFLPRPSSAGKSLSSRDVSTAGGPRSTQPWPPARSPGRKFD